MQLCDGLVYTDFNHSRGPGLHSSVRGQRSYWWLERIWLWDAGVTYLPWFSFTVIQLLYKLFPQAISGIKWIERKCRKCRSCDYQDMQRFDTLWGPKQSASQSKRPTAIRKPTMIGTKLRIVGPRHHQGDENITVRKITSKTHNTTVCVWVLGT